MGWSKFDLQLCPWPWTYLNKINVSNGTSWWRRLLQIYIEIHPKLQELWFRQKFDLVPTWMNVANGTSTHDGEELCQIILKSIHNCRRKDGPTHAHTPNCPSDNYVTLKATKKNPWCLVTLTWPKCWKRYWTPRKKQTSSCCFKVANMS